MRLLVISVIIITLNAVTPASAQSREDVVQGIEECKALSIEFMRTACLEAADRFLENIPGTAPSSPEPGAPAIAPSETTNTAALEAERAALARDRAELKEALAALEEKDTQASENERLGVLARLGLARNAEKSDEELSATLTITRVKANSAKLYTLWTSDGDILVQQAGGRRMRLPDSFPSTATLKRSRFGSKWITFTDSPKRSYKVKVHRKD